MKLLVVDDSMKMQKMIGDVFGDDTTIEIIACRDSSKALTYYTTHQPTYVFMDIAMPKVDGLTATRLIRQQYPEAKIIMVTNYDDPYLRQAATREGAIGFVPKDNLLKVREYINET